MMPSSNVSKYIYSFSGSDVVNTCWYSIFNNREILNSTPGSLDSLTTVSFSLHEAKLPVRALGYRACKGYTGGIRTIAGNMIATVIKDHPLKILMDQYNEFKSKMDWNWSLDNSLDGSGYTTALTPNKYLQGRSIFPTMLPPFNIAFFANNEIDFKIIDSSYSDPNSSARVNWDFTANQVPFTQLILIGVEFLDDGLVLSTNNPMSEMTFSFVARDYAVLSSTSNVNVLDEIGAAGLDGLTGIVQTVYPENSDTDIMSTLEDMNESTNRSTTFVDPLTAERVFRMEAGDI